MSQFESPPLFKGGMLRQDFGVSAQQQKNELAQAIKRRNLPPLFAVSSAVKLLYSGGLLL
jgi:hypothetical protein